MRKRIATLLLGALTVGLSLGIAQLLQWRLTSGDVFPEYSSLRDDPLGLGVFYDALSQLPEMRVDRNLRPLSTLPAEPARTIILAGSATGPWSKVPRDEFDALNLAVRGGSRLIIAFRAQAAVPRSKPPRDDATHRSAPAGRKKSADPATPGHPLPESVDLQRRWGAVPRERRLVQPQCGAIRSGDAAASLPSRIAWASDTCFKLTPGAGWRVLYRRGGFPVVIERTLGKGSIVLAGDSYFLSNEALQRHRSSALLAWVVGPLRHVTFDETHLGVVADPGVASLARKYGLWPAGVSLLLLAALFVWQRSVWFVPPPPDAEEIELSYHPAAGLHALLRRSVPPAEVVAACVAEWRQTARDTDRQRMDQALAAAPKDASPPEFYNRLVRALHRR